MDREKEIVEELGKMHDELNHIRYERLKEYRKQFIGKYYRTYIDDGRNRYEYIFVEKIENDDLYGWWFSIGDTFTHEYSILSEDHLNVNFVADDSFYATFKTDRFREIDIESFFEEFQRVVDCVKGKNAELAERFLKK